MPYSSILYYLMLGTTPVTETEPRNATDTRLDSAFYDQRSVAAIPKIEVCAVDTSEEFYFQSTYYIYGDTIYLQQYFQSEDDPWTENEWYTCMQIKLPLPENAERYRFEVGNERGKLPCDQIQAWYLSINFRLHSARGQIELLSLSDSVLVFREDVSTLTLQDNKSPTIYHYDGVEVAFRTNDDLLFPPDVPGRQRKVIW